jgi:hypothetical protein
MRPPLVSRRTVLRGAGAVIALPWLEAMLPRGLASSAAAAAMPLAPGAAATPTRVAYLFFPNGVNVDAWTPTAGADGRWAPSPTLAPLAEFRDAIDVHTGLHHRHAEANGDGPGDHARSAACFLTGMQPRKTAGDDIRVGKSIDQILADDLFEQGVRTRLRSLELGSEPAMTSGNCDSGYSCAYSANISWRSESLPNGKETDPRAVFDRVFGARGESPEQAAARLHARRSILDGAVREAKRLARSVGSDDRARLDEYLEGVRDLELRLRDDALADVDALDAMPDFDRAPRDIGSRIDLLGEVLALAFKVDATRVATLMLANEGSNRPYREVGVSEGHHDVSHHGKNAEKLEKFATINRFHSERFAAFLRALSRVKENGKPLLDSTVVLYGGAIADGNRHNHDDLPILVAGGGARRGRVIASRPGTPLNNLHVGVARAAGGRIERFGDANGVVVP